MKKIVIAIDYAPTAERVAELGYTLGKTIKAAIVLLHVIEEVGYYSATAYDPIMGFGGFTNEAFLGTDVLQDIEKEANNYLEKIKLHLNDKEIKTLVAHGKIADTILKTAANEKCDLIVIGTKNKSGYEEFILGSTAHRLLIQSTMPLYIIPANNTKNEI